MTNLPKNYPVLPKDFAENLASFEIKTFVFVNTKFINSNSKYFQELKTHLVESRIKTIELETSQNYKRTIIKDGKLFDSISFLDPPKQTTKRRITKALDTNLDPVTTIACKSMVNFVKSLIALNRTKNHNSNTNPLTLANENLVEEHQINI